MTIPAPMILLVGNSGSGKDTLIHAVQQQWPPDLPQLVVPKRVITRPPHPSEPYQGVSEAQFAHMKVQGHFCLTWVSYGLDYGVPASVLDDRKKGRPVLVNVSRTVIEYARTHLPNVHVAYIQVPLAVTLERIRRRGREKPDSVEFKERLERAKANPLMNWADVVINNEGAIEIASGHLYSYIKSHLTSKTRKPDKSICGRQRKSRINFFQSGKTLSRSQ